MTEWWVSQAKKWCDICKVWHGGHIQQILKHKSGIMHQTREEAMLKSSRQREKDRKADEKAVLSEIAKIERAAEAAMRASGPGPFGGEPQATPAQEAAAGASSSGTARGAQQEAFASAMWAQKRTIERTVQEAAKRRRAESVGGAVEPEMAVAAPVQAAQLQQPARPEHFSVDLSRAPPPPPRKPPPPPPRKQEGAVGGWEEVRPEDSMWAGTRQQGDEDDSDAEPSNEREPRLPSWMG
mmetsp:Transcript_105875/g.330125  ORF Transcript_105875/g.330125 Transcript_105875/m.330125 type:complete len:239 (+) Transcript_105875:86-802(+)